MIGRLLIRADANPQIGTGHVMRCVSLAQAWRCTGEDVIFALGSSTPGLEQTLRNEDLHFVSLLAPLGTDPDAKETARIAREHGAGWVVADGYHFGAQYQYRIKDSGLGLLLVGDYGSADHYYADLILNQNLHATDRHYGNREPYTRLLLGTRYTLLRRQFLSFRDWAREIPSVARKVLVTLGGVDIDNVTGKVIEALKEVHEENLEAVVALGGSNPHVQRLTADIRGLQPRIKLIVDAQNMPELMAWADVAVAAGGSTSWEIAFMGLPSLIIVLADNQADIATGLDREGISISLGVHTTVRVEQIAKALRPLLVDALRRQTMSQRGRQLVDGYGSDRVVQAMQQTMLIGAPAGVN